MNDLDPRRRVAEFNFADAEERLRYQHEFSIAGLKTLILINGGAMIALLTYAGNSSVKGVASHLSLSMMAYAAGLVAGVLAYVTGYLSQGFVMQGSVHRAYENLGFKQPETERSARAWEKLGGRWIYAAIALAVLSLIAFMIGSGLAMTAIA